MIQLDGSTRSDLPHGMVTFWPADKPVPEGWSRYEIKNTRRRKVPAKKKQTPRTTIKRLREQVVRAEEHRQSEYNARIKAQGEAGERQKRVQELEGRVADYERRSSRAMIVAAIERLQADIVKELGGTSDYGTSSGMTHGHAMSPSFAPAVDTRERPTPAGRAKWMSDAVDELIAALIKLQDLARLA